MIQAATHIGLIEDTVIAAARKIDELIISKSSIEVRRKQDKSLVMTLDLESQKVCLAQLSRYGLVVAEEDPDSHSLVNSSGLVFVVDPLDGTSACKRFMGTEGGPIGFGPMIGAMQNGRMLVASYYNLPTKTLFTAIRSGGAYQTQIDLQSREKLKPLDSRLRLELAEIPSLSDSAVLFYTGTAGEARIVEELRRRKLIETAYRFGGFANDCSRLALGCEQALIQFAVKAWDFPAVLFAKEAGLEIVVDPLGAKQDLDQWRVKDNNPVIIAAKKDLELILEVAELAS